MTDVAEGTIVRVITRLDETCREVRDAARVIGDAELFKKMEECQTKIKRDSEYDSLSKPYISLTTPASCICRKFVFLDQSCSLVMLSCYMHVIAAALQNWYICDIDSLTVPI